MKEECSHARQDYGTKRGAVDTSSRYVTGDSIKHAKTKVKLLDVTKIFRVFKSTLTAALLVKVSKRLH